MPRRPNDSLAIHWCEHCGVPLAVRTCGICGKEGHRLARDLVPVFKEELGLLSGRLGFQLLSSPRDLHLWSCGTGYYQEGHRVATIRYRGSSSPSLEAVSIDGNLPRYKRPKDTGIVPRLFAANKDHILSLESEAMQFVARTSASYQGHIQSVAFSGGKDSTVISHLVRKALGSANVLHVFSDTTLELSDTSTYINRFRKANPHTPFVVLRPHMDFHDLCSRIGPPSRIQRWCCTSHKTAPMATMISILSRDCGVLTFDGIRASESVRRAKYERITTDHKIENEVLASPIREWRDFDVWLYMLTSDLPFNAAYRKGFRRVGCLPCPLNSQWSEFLASIWYTKEAEDWQAFLLDYALSTGNPAPERFVRSGWRTRAGGRGLNHSLASVVKEPCLKESATYSYTLATDWKESFFDYLKPFGNLTVTYDDGVKLKASLTSRIEHVPLAFLTVVRPRRFLRVSFVEQGNLRLMMQRFEKQIKRFQSCVLCGGCASHCPRSAVHLNGRYEVDGEVCVGCLRCVRSRCPAAESLTLKGAADGRKDGNGSV